MDSDKSCALVEYLKRHERPVTAKELADFLNLSTRTVKKYISMINEEFKKTLIFSGHSGYEVNGREAGRYLQKHRKKNCEVPQNYEERSAYINKKFLKYHINKLNLYDLAEELNYSAETIRGDLKKMNSSFAGYGVSYELHSDDIYLVADEKSLRRLARYCLLDNQGDRMISYASIKKAFENIDVDSIRVIMEQELMEQELYVNDFSFMNLILHIIIVIYRIMDHNVLMFKATFRPDKASPEYRATEKICAKIEENLHLEFNKEEKENIYLLLKANTNLPLWKNREELYEMIGADLMEFVKEIIRELGVKYYINLYSQDFIFPFSMHIKNLILRARHNQSNINPMCKAVRYSHPMVFDMAVHTALLINKKFHIRLDENELSYLALHIGGELERQEDNREKVRTVLLCPAYLELSAKITNQLLTSFGDEIELLACINGPEHVKKYRFELLITTVEIDIGQCDYSVIYVPILGIEREKNKIENIVEEIREKRRIHILAREFERIFSPRMFFVNHKKDSTAKEIMRTMAERMEEEGAVQEDFYERLLERELAASTAFPNIAIPHSMSLDAIKTSICVMLCPEGVAWGGNHVKIVMAIAIHKADAFLFKDLYQALISLFDNERNLRMLLSQETFEDFAEWLKHMI